jgi:roadblock/LC7 domain-containing protein
VEGEIKKGEEANIVKIVALNLITKFSDDAKVLKGAKEILKKSARVPAETVESVKNAYKQLKSEDYAKVLEQLYPLND